MTSQAAPYPIFSPSANVTATRSFDAENHLNLTTFETPAPNPSAWPQEQLTWGPDGHPAVVATSKNGGAVKNERLHWVGDQILFTTHNVGGAPTLDDVKLGAQGDILPGDTYSGLTFYDRGPGGMILGCHNATGTSYVGFSNGFMGLTESPCGSGLSQGAKMPSSTVWTGTPYGGGLSVGNGGTLGMPRPDGFTDGYDTIQGVRAYDSTSGLWTTPDQFAGVAQDPASQKSYQWNGSNPNNNMDPSGYFSWTPPWEWPNWGDDPGDALWNDYLDNLLTIAVVTAHCQGCHQWQISKSYSVTTSCNASASQVMNAVESNFPNFGNYSRWGGAETVSFSPPSDMSPGSNIPITVGILGINQNLSVTVQSMNAQSMTFTTNPGHLLYPAFITFSASPSDLPNWINFNINLGGTVAQPAEFTFGGSNFEDAQWNHFLGKVTSYCGAGG